MVLNVPNTNIDLHPGDIIRIGRFSEVDYEVQYGWYTWGGNRPVCGWSLRDISTGDVKPLQSIDLTDVYMISHAPTPSSESVIVQEYTPLCTYTTGQLVRVTDPSGVSVYIAARSFVASDISDDVQNGNIFQI